MDRRRFLAAVGAAAGGAALSGPLTALMARVAQAQAPTLMAGYGEPVPIPGAAIYLPPGFSYTVVQRQGDPMTPVDPVSGIPDPAGVSYPTPSRFDGMDAMPGPDGTTILIRNHENKRRYTGNPAVVPFIPGNEVDVVVPTDKRYDTFYNGGVVKVVVKDGQVVESYPLLGGTTHNCAGGMTPWGTWLTCEEFFQTNTPQTNIAHGYVFEVDPSSRGPVDPVPIVAAGRFEHEAVAWHDGYLYETEDIADACFYRYRPNNQDDLAAGGTLEALRLTDFPGLDTRLRNSWPGRVGTSHAVEWVPIANPNPASNAGAGSVRRQGQASGAAIFARLEGCWTVKGKIYFDATTGGATALTPASNLGFGQIYEYDPDAATLTLIFEVDKTRPVLVRPDNLAPLLTTGDLYLCEDNVGSGSPQANHIRGLTPKGQVFRFAEAAANTTEFAGVCFSPDFTTMFVNQHGDNSSQGGVTYAITGPWMDARIPEGIGRPTPSPSS